MSVLARSADEIPSGMPTIIASSIASPPSSAETGKCSLTMSFTVWFRSTSDGPRSNVTTPLT